MKLTIDGYGDGAFSKLRCVFNLLETSPTTSPGTPPVFGEYPLRHRQFGPEFILKGDTVKTGPTWMDNEVTFTFHDLSEDEATIFAQSLLEYVRFLQISS